MLGGALLAFACSKSKTGGEEPAAPQFSVPAGINKTNTSGDGYTIPVTASDGVSWSASVPAGNDWITLSTASGKGNGAVTFSLTANDNSDKRTVDVTFTATATGATIPSQVCTVTQIGTAPAIEISPSGTANVPIDANAAYTIAVTANVEWTASLQIASGPAGWISLTSPTAPVTGAGNVTLNILANTSETARTATVTVVSTTDPSLTQTLTITQAGIIPSIVIDPTGTASLPATADNAYTVTVTSNIEWLVSIDIAPTDAADWVSVVSPTAATTGNGTVTLSIAANNTMGPRTATVHVSSTAHPTDATLNKTLVITQINSGATFTIAIPGYTALTTGAATMSISPYPSGSALPGVPGQVTSDASGASISFSQTLSAGNYLVNSIAGATTVPVGAVITVNGVGVVTFVEHWDVPFNCFGGNFAGRPIKVNNATDLNTLRTAVNGGNSYAGLTLQQTAAITLTGAVDPIGNDATHPFAGVYDGNNLSITGLSINAGPAMALFGNVGGINADSVAVVKNLTVTGSGGAGADLTGDANGAVAGIVANVAANTNISGCTNRANIAGASSNIGGCVAVCAGNNITLTGCANYGTITGSAGNNGGIVANINGAAGETINVTSCANYGDMPVAAAGTSATGGIAGRSSATTTSEIKWCSNRGTITLTVNATNGTGGIIGYQGGNATVRECFNLGVISALTNIGGISGLLNNNTNAAAPAVYDCYNKGTITFGTVTAVNSAGVAGNLTGAKTAPVVTCYNAGSTLSTGAGAKFGGIVASNTMTAFTDLSGVNGCFYETGKGYTAGIGGNLVPADVAGVAEGKATADMQSATPYTSAWSTSVWKFTVGAYPALINNPE